jgi:hypothetical protein
MVEIIIINPAGNTFDMNTNSLQKVKPLKNLDHYFGVFVVVRFKLQMKFKTRDISTRSIGAGWAFVTER